MRISRTPRGPETPSVGWGAGLERLLLLYAYFIVAAALVPFGATYLREGVLTRESLRAALGGTL